MNLLLGIYSFFLAYMLSSIVYKVRLLNNFSIFNEKIILSYSLDGDFERHDKAYLIKYPEDKYGIYIDNDFVDNLIEIHDSQSNANYFLLGLKGLYIIPKHKKQIRFIEANHFNRYAQKILLKYFNMTINSYQDCRTMAGNCQK